MTPSAFTPSAASSVWVADPTSGLEPGRERPVGASSRSRTIEWTPSPRVPDVSRPALRVLFCGINPGRVSAARGAHFANPRNDFWRLLHAAGFTQRWLAPPSNGTRSRTESA